MAGMLLADACTSDSDDVVGSVLWDRFDYGIGYVDYFLADDKFHNEILSFDGVLHREGAKNQQAGASYNQGCSKYCNSHNAYVFHILNIDFSVIVTF